MHFFVKIDYRPNSREESALFDTAKTKRRLTR
jgi:hypothetical protein